MRANGSIWKRKDEEMATKKSGKKDPVQLYDEAVEELAALKKKVKEQTAKVKELQPERDKVLAERKAEELERFRSAAEAGASDAGIQAAVTPDMVREALKAWAERHPEAFAAEDGDTEGGSATGAAGGREDVAGL